MLMLGICTLALLQSAPITVPAQWTGSSWAVDATVDGSIKGHLVISTGITLSRVSETWLGAAAKTDQHRLSIGGYSAGTANFTVGNYSISGQNGQVYDGEIGMDVLSDCAIGFDWTTRTIKIWPGGHVDEAQARQWVSGGDTYPGETEPPTATTIPLALDEVHHLPQLSGTVDGQSAKMRIWSRMFQAALKDDQVKADPTDPAGMFALDLGFPAPWNYSSPESLYGDDARDAPGISLRSLLARRVILDFPGGVAYRQQLPDRQMAELCLSMALPVEVHVDGTRLRIGPTDEFSFINQKTAKDYSNDQIRRVANVDAADLVKLIDAGMKRDPATVVDLFKRIGSTPSLTFVHHGREVTATMSVARG